MSVAILHLHLMGPPRILYRDRPVHGLETRRLLSLLSFLVLQSGRMLERSQVAQQLWPEHEEGERARNLRNLLYRLRQAIPDADHHIVLEDSSVGWNVHAPTWTDVSAFEALLSQPLSNSVLQSALDLYRGPLLPTCHDAWIEPVRARLHLQARQLLLAGMAWLEGRRDYGQAIDCGERLLVLDPTCETAYQALMRLHALSGDLGAAQRVFKRCATILERELGVAPDDQTIQLRRQLSTISTAPPDRGPLETPLIGRQAEWNLLVDAWRSTERGGARLMLLRGPAGIGKSRLAKELLRWVAAQGAPVASASCYGGDRLLPYVPLEAFLRQLEWPKLAPHYRSELARILPELLDQPGVSPPQPLTEPWQRWRFYAALARAILARSPLLLCLENLQTCDAESLAWLRYVFQQTPAPRLLLVAELNDDEAEPGGNLLRDFLPSLSRAGLLSSCDLGPLSREHVVELARQESPTPLSDAVLEQVIRSAEGNPLFVVELVRGGGWTEGPVLMPPRSLRDFILSRIATLSPRAQELARLGAVIGHTVDLSLLETLGAAKGGILQELNELFARNILREKGNDHCDFAHGMIRDVLYAHMPAVTRRWLHQRVAEVLEHRLNRTHMATLGQLAFHFEHGGEQRKAARYALKAGEAALQVYALKEAGHYFELALSQLESHHDDLAQDAWSGLLSVRMVTGPWQSALDAVEKLEALRPQTDAPDAFALQLKLSRARLLTRMGKAELAEQLASAVLDSARSLGLAELEARAIHVLAIRATHAARYRTCDDLIDRALNLTGTQALIGVQLKLVFLGVFSLSRQMRWHAAIRQIERGLELSGGSPQLEEQELSLRRSLCTLQLQLGRIAEASRGVRDVTRRSRELDHNYLLQRALLDQAAICVAQHHIEEASTAAREGLRLAMDAGDAVTGCQFHHVLALCGALRGDFLSAESELEAGGRLLSSDASRSREDGISQIRAYLALLRGDFDTALRLVERALAEGPDTGGALLNAQFLGFRGQALVSTARPTEALAVLQQALSLLPEKRLPGYPPTHEFPIRVDMARAHLALGESAEALTTLGTLFDQIDAEPGIYPDHHWLHFVHHQALQAVGEKRRAELALRRARGILLERAARLKEPAAQQQFLENVWTHRQIMLAWERHPKT